MDGGGPSPPSWAQVALEGEGDNQGGQSKLLTIRHMAVAVRIPLCWLIARGPLASAA